MELVLDVESESADRSAGSARQADARRAGGHGEAVLSKNGGSTPDFARLFMMPGVAHCGGGVGPDRIDAVTAVIDWVETPQVARYAGQGSMDEAANFRCVALR